VELAEQYKEMDAMSNVRKRNILAQHLKEVVDILEQKARPSGYLVIYAYEKTCSRATRSPHCMIC
jgi:hypothetical protein